MLPFSTMWVGSWIVVLMPVMVKGTGFENCEDNHHLLIIENEAAHNCQRLRVARQCGT